VLQPDGDHATFTVDLPAGAYRVEWFDVSSRETRFGEQTVVTSPNTVGFSSPFPSGPVVLYLSHVE
jgi:hypothetical protein